MISCTVILAVCILYIDLVRSLKYFQIISISFGQLSFIACTQLFHDMDASIAIILMAASTAISNLFAYCYFGQLATESFEQMAIYLYCSSNWLELPHKLQKYIVVMILNMQRPIHYHGFRVALLNLKTFIQVRNG